MWPREPNVAARTQCGRENPMWPREPDVAGGPQLFERRRKETGRRRKMIWGSPSAHFPRLNAPRTSPGPPGKLRRFSIFRSKNHGKPWFSREPDVAALRPPAGEPGEGLRTLRRQLDTPTLASQRAPRHGGLPANGTERAGASEKYLN